MNSEIGKEVNNLFGRKLKIAREIEREESQGQFAQATGLGEKHISKLENGNMEPKLRTLLKLRIAGVDIYRIMDEIIQELEEEGKEIIDDYR